MMRLAFGIALLTLMGVAARAAPDDLDELMRLLAARQHGQVDFVEQHFLALLTRPVESWGELFYDAPDRLEKRTLEPRPESLVLAGDVLTIRRGRHSHVLDVKAYPQILPFVESIRATLAGDRGALERVFRVEYTGNLERWTMILVPRESAVAKTISQVRIDGSRDTLRTVEIREVDGDRSLMTLRDHPAP
ncbi:MAG: LolA-related protein [Steroidobacteraceae bacterium]